MSTLRTAITVVIVSNLLIPSAAPALTVAVEEPRDAMMYEATQVSEAGESERDRLKDLIEQSGRSTAVQIARSRWPFQSGATAAVLVIPSAEIETNDLLMINEDVNVMSRIFETSLQQARISPSGSSLLINPRRHSTIFATLSGRRIQSLYLQGYGVLFLMTVDFPLSPPPQDQEQDNTEKEEEVDKVWQATRRNLYEPRKADRYKKGDSAPEYDAETVENLKATLIKALKHATNIRNLKAEESVIFSITGGDDSASDPMTILAETIVVQGGERVIQKPASVTVGLPTVLVIRAKKADIDSFAKGDLDLEKFRQRVQILSYPYLHGGSQR